MLSYMRPAGSPSERDFIKKFIAPYKPRCITGANQMVIVPGDSTTLFSCHTDTVHRDSGKQVVQYDANIDCAYVDGKDPLGADNTAGVWLLLEMIEAKIPGTYLFHWGEERGCIGSRALAQKEDVWLRGFERAIAFDRRGTSSVITHQHGDRCCSALFGTALALALGNGYTLDSTGLYTDTASYMALIPECTNVSVGYDHEHSPAETLDLAHCRLLRDQVLTIDWKSLPTSRDPSVLYPDPVDDFDLITDALAESYDRRALEELTWRDTEYILDLLQALLRSQERDFQDDH